MFLMKCSQTAHRSLCDSPSFGVIAYVLFWHLEQARILCLMVLHMRQISQTESEAPGVETLPLYTADSSLYKITANWHQKANDGT